MAKKKARVRLIDTTFRDAQQSLLGGYLRTDEIVPIAAKMDSIGFAAMEAFGGATFETQLRIHEDPWDFLRKLNHATPNTPIQALVRGQNLVAKRNFSDDVVELFIKHAAKAGVDVFRIFDPLNDLRNMEASIAAALKAKKRVQGTLSYAISPAHNIELWGSLAKGLVNMGCHETAGDVGARDGAEGRGQSPHRRALALFERHGAHGLHGRGRGRCRDPGRRDLTPGMGCLTACSRKRGGRA